MQSSCHAPESETLAEFAMWLADQTDRMAMDHFRKPLDVERKADLSPVTKADRAIEAAMRQSISKKFPEHGILGEEHENTRLDATHVWVLDPIDGTKSFITGMPTFGTLIACLSGGSPKLGLISIPPTRERWLGVRGKSTMMNGRNCLTSGRLNLAESTLYATTPDTFDEAGQEKFQTLSGKVGMRRFGGDCYAYGLLASGHIDLVMEMGLQPYDFMALVPVIEGAGGVITDWEGKRLGLLSDGKVIAAANVTLHAKAIAAVT